MIKIKTIRKELNKNGFINLQDFSNKDNFFIKFFVLEHNNEEVIFNKLCNYINFLNYKETKLIYNYILINNLYVYLDINSNICIFKDYNELLKFINKNKIKHNTFYEKEYKNFLNKENINNKLRKIEKYIKLLKD